MVQEAVVCLGKAQEPKLKAEAWLAVDSTWVVIMDSLDLMASVRVSSEVARGQRHREP